MLSSTLSALAHAGSGGAPSRRVRLPKDLEVNPSPGTAPFQKSSKASVAEGHEVPSQPVSCAAREARRVQLGEDDHIGEADEEPRSRLVEVLNDGLDPAELVRHQLLELRNVSAELADGVGRGELGCSLSRCKGCESPLGDAQAPVHHRVLALEDAVRLLVDVHAGDGAVPNADQEDALLGVELGDEERLDT